MAGLIGKKLGMTSIFTEDRRNVPVTVLEIGPNVVTQVKTEATDGYQAVQIAYGDKKEKNTPNPMLGHFKKAGTTPKRVVREVDLNTDDYKPGQQIKLEDLFEIGEFVDVIGTSKGKGFQGVVKRHGFAGVGGQTHGQHNRLRAPGAIGACSFPSRVFKGMKMGGQMGNVRVKVQNLQIVDILAEHNVLLVSGPVPGAKGGYIQIEK